MMPAWQIASLIFFAYVIAVTGWPGRPRPARPSSLYGAVAAGALVVLGVSALPYHPVLHDWIAPPVVLLVGYWVSGKLFVAPNPAQERALLDFDERLNVTGLARRMPPALAAVLEVAYACVYPLIPLALIVRVLFLADPDPAQFWSVILVTDYICFAFLAWIQTRPPRSIERTDPWNSIVRRFNLGLLGTASIQVNTFPSGHAAEALACALLVLGAPWPVFLAMLVAALPDPAGAVFGRYHYALDAITGWLVAIAVWVMFWL